MCPKMFGRKSLISLGEAFMGFRGIEWLEGKNMDE